MAGGGPSWPGQEKGKEQEEGQENGEELGQEKELTWQVDLAELNLQVSHPTASTSSPQLIFLISQSFLANLAHAAV